MNKYLVHLSGIKDQEIFLCDKEHFDWILDGNIIPTDFDFIGVGEANGWPEDKSEEWQLDEMKNYSDNDRAMYLSWCKNAICFFDIQEYTKYITKNKINILETYTGYIY